MQRGMQTVWRNHTQDDTSSMVETLTIRKHIIPKPMTPPPPISQNSPTVHSPIQTHTHTHTHTHHMPYFCEKIKLCKLPHCETSCVVDGHIPPYVPAGAKIVPFVKFGLPLTWLCVCVCVCVCVYHNWPVVSLCRCLLSVLSCLNCNGGVPVSSGFPVNVIIYVECWTHSNLQKSQSLFTVSNHDLYMLGVFESECLSVYALCV